MILMSATNPNGYKLEELLKQIADEVQQKSDLIAPKSESDPAAKALVKSNSQIIWLLNLAIEQQQEALKMLTELRGADQGPTGTPRI